MLDSPNLSIALAAAAGETEHAAADSASVRLEEEVVELFGQLRSPLLRYVGGIGLPVQDGEEIVQEVFLALFQHLRQGKSRTNLRGWVFRVAHNLALRRRLRMRVTETTAAEGDLATDLAADPGPSPEYQAATRQTHARLHAVLRALPEQERQCLVLRAEGLRYREIAQVLDMSLGSVSMSLARSLARMARAAQTGESLPRHEKSGWAGRTQSAAQGARDEADAPAERIPTVEPDCSGKAPIGAGGARVQR